jgi:hypothetical protein
MSQKLIHSKKNARKYDGSHPRFDFNVLGRPKMNNSKLLPVFAIFSAALLPHLPAETLYNGIALPAEWPPRQPEVTSEPAETPPYLLDPPEVIPIDVGRQLFVDYFLIEKTTLHRAYHHAEYFKGNPVLRPEYPWEFRGKRGQAMAFSDGVWYDPGPHLFKAWYVSGPNTLYATSNDGVHWDKPLLDVKPGTNIVLPGKRDSSTVWYDWAEKDPNRRYKLVFYRRPEGWQVLYYSADGIHWGDEITHSLKIGDRSTAFWNPFRKVWVLSLRQGSTPESLGPGYDVPKYGARIRYYVENPDLAAALGWKEGQPDPWTGADRLDATRIEMGVHPELYNLDSVAYESLMIGLFSVWRGQPDRDTRDKPDEICIGFSRDGFHWDRPDRKALIPVSEDPQAWNWGNVQSVGGGCLVVGDRLYFYMSGRATGPNRPGNDATGLATIRRDGFVSMNAGDAGGILTTRRVRFSGKYLFVNVNSAEGGMRVEVLDSRNRVIAPFSVENCIPIRVDNTIQAVRWKGAADLAALAGTPVKFRFHLRHGSLYSFWVTPDRSGASHGYVAAGGPGFTGPTDTVGLDIYDHNWIRKVLN